MVKWQEEFLWHDLLESTGRDFFSEHSSRETNSLNAVTILKPTWTCGPGCCCLADLGELPLQDLEEETGMQTDRGDGPGDVFRVLVR